VSMTLSQCIPPDISPVLVEDKVITGMTLDSRQVSRGDLFIACHGISVDGHDYAQDAQARGAAAVFSEHVIQGLEIPVIVVPELKSRAGSIAAHFYGDASANMQVIGITGTNGKTSVAYYVATLLGLLGIRSAYFGTLGWGELPELSQSDLTTSDSVLLQRRLALMRQKEIRTVSMEVSSHALNQNRVDAIEFDVAVFTNLSRDHLDYHKSMENYAQAKRKLFFMDSVRSAIVNIDDKVGRSLFESLDTRLNKISFGKSESADIRWHKLEFLPDAVSGEIFVYGERYAFALPLYGEFSVENFSAALGVLLSMKFTAEQVLGESQNLSAVPGRMQIVTALKGFAVVIDFAHTPDALEKALAAARLHMKGSLLCVFGCGGDRDAGKRSEMASVAERGSDLVWVTNDNPRTEAPAKIVEDILSGFLNPENVHVELDRKRAIRIAMCSAKPGDVVLIAGKGHENYQEIRGEKHPFSDFSVVQELAGANI
jgi:UDP-N-acetylmuramoyl-L-alanyl-D-glutamate--2,6-diaminopimelate ligase